jgi:hypothetical protein
MTFLIGVGRFWYELIIGDDPKIACAVVLALSVTAALLFLGLPESVVTVTGGLLVLGFFTAALFIDLRPRRPKG